MTKISDLPDGGNPQPGDAVPATRGGSTEHIALGAFAPANATDSGTDAYEANLGVDVEANSVVMVDFQSANTTTTPSLKNTGGDPSGGITIKTRDGNALWAEALGRVHCLLYDGTDYRVLDPVYVTAQEEAYSQTETYSKTEVDSRDKFLKANLLHVQDQKSSGTNGGSSSGDTWHKRDLNTVLTNEISGASLSSSQVTLEDGTYYIEASAPAYRSNRHHLRLRDVTNGVTLLEGSSSYAKSNYNVQTRSVVVGRFELSAQTVIELQHGIDDPKNVNGLGIGFGNVLTVSHEVFTNAVLWEVA
jgi:hypothetical protein